MSFHKFINLILLFFTTTLHANPEWTPPTSPPLHEDRNSTPQLSIGLGGNIGQSRASDGSGLSPIWYSGIQVGYFRPVGHWNHLGLVVEVQNGQISKQNFSYEQDLGINFLAKYGKMNTDDLSFMWIGGVGIGRGQWKQDVLTGSMKSSLFRIGYGVFTPFTEATQLGFSGLLDFIAYQTQGNAPISPSSETQLSVQLTLEHLLPLN